MRRSLRNTTCRTSRRCRCLCRWTSDWCAMPAASWNPSWSSCRPSLPSTDISRLRRIRISSRTICRLSLGIYLRGHTSESYWKLMRQLIVGGHDPANVILMEIDPEHQKTLPDFLITQRELGIAIVDITSLVKRGNRLFYRKQTAKRSRCVASTTVASSTNWSARGSRCLSIFAMNSMSSGRAIRTGTFASASFPSLI